MPEAPTLYGTTTSPYVRRVRIVAAELGVACRLVDVFTDAGQAELRATAPTWKVPTVRFPDGAVHWDSRAIVGELVRRHGWGPLRPSIDAGREDRLLAAVDSALDSAVNVFYLRRDGVDVDRVPYLVKQQARVDACLGWVAGELDGSWFRGHAGFGEAEIALLSALGWMRLRAVWNPDAVAAFRVFEAAHAERASVATSAPGK